MSDRERNRSSDVLRSEAHCIEIIANAFSCAGVQLDASDDCGAPHASTDLVSTDSLCEGAHFDRKYDTPEQIGRQAAIVNLSDLAGSGAQAGWLVWALSLNDAWTESCLHGLAYGFGSVAATYSASILGGNLSRTEGPTIIGVTVGGPLTGEHPLLRSNAQVGDEIYLSGPIGRATQGYMHPSPTFRQERHRWRPHLEESSLLAITAGVHACMDVSDGLLKDAGRMADASELSMHLETAQIPFVGEQDIALRGGEDYVLLFSARPNTQLPDWATPIGVCRPGSGVYLNGHQVQETGYDHFLERQ